MAKTNAQRAAEYRSRNKDNPEYRQKQANYSKKWKDNNKEKLRKYARDYQKSRRDADPLFSMAHRMRNRLCRYIARGSAPKSKSQQEFIGCSWADFVMHIERQFSPGMGWHNRSEWHLDHIIPLAQAKNEGDLKFLGHFTNIRPMWAKDNRKKNAKLENLL